MSFNAGIDDMLDSFFERHERDMSDSAANDFKTTLRRLKRSAETLREYSYNEPKLMSTVQKLYARLRNEVGSVLHHDVPRQRAAQMSTQDVPRSRDKLDDMGFMRQVIAEENDRIKQQLRNTREWGVLSQLQIDATKPQDELYSVQLQISVSQMEQQLWRASADKHQVTIYDDEIKRVGRQIARLEIRKNQLISQVNHTAYEAVSRSRSQPVLRLRGGVGTPAASPSLASPSLSATRYGSEETGRPSLLDAKIAARATAENYLGVLVTNDEPGHIQKRFGVRAKGIVDLYKQFGHGELFDPEDSLGGILKYLEFDANLGLDDPIPQDVLATYTQGNRPMFREGTTLRTFLHKYASQFPTEGTLQQHYMDHIRDKPDMPKILAKQLIGKGVLTGKSKEMKLPSRKLVELFRRMRANGHLEHPVAVEQLFVYSKSRPQTVPEELDAHMKDIYSKRPKRGVSGLDRQKMALLRPFFNIELGKKFFSMKFREQARELRSNNKKHPIGNPNNWRKILTDFFGYDKKLLPESRSVHTSYTAEEAERIWAPLSKEFQTLMKHAGLDMEQDENTLRHAMNYLQFHSAGLSPSPESERRERQRQRAATESEVEAKADEVEAKADEVVTMIKPVEVRELEDKVYFDHFVEVTPNINFHDTSKPPGYSLLEGFEQSWKKWAKESNREGKDRGLRTFENMALIQLKTAFGRLDRYVRYIFPRLATNSRNTDADAQKEIFLKMGWNVYMSRQRVPAGRSASEFMFRNIPPLNEAYHGKEPIFKPEEREYLEEMLLSLLAADTISYNMKTKGDDGAFRWKGSVEASKHLIMLKQRTDYFKAEAEKIYTKIESEIGPTFPMPDWRERLANHQAQHLLDVFGKEGKKLKAAATKRAYKNFNDVRSSVRERRKTRWEKEAEKQRKQASAAARAGRIGGGGDAPDVMTPFRVSESREFAAPQPRVRGRSLSREAEDAVAEAMQDPGFQQLAPQEQEAAIEKIIEAEVSPEESEEEDMLDLGVAVDDAEEEAVAHLYAMMYEPVEEARVKHRYGVVADALHPMSYGNLTQMHLLQTDNNVAPIMGRVHMVRPDREYAEDHFMHDVEGDINEGQKTLVERSKRGPFRNQSGRSTIMDRSRHIVYRKRRGVFEITIRRGVIDSELNQMISKLRMHRTHQHGSRITIVKGSRRYRLGFLTDVDLRHLLDLVAECINQYGNCGIEIVETRPSSGPLYKDSMHMPSFKANKKGVLHKR